MNTPQYIKSRCYGTCIHFQAVWLPTVTNTYKWGRNQKKNKKFKKEKKKKQKLWNSIYASLSFIKSRKSHNFQQYTSSRLFKQKMNSNKPVQSEETTVNFKPKSTPAPLDRGVMEAYTLAASASPHATVLVRGNM